MARARRAAGAPEARHGIETLAARLLDGAADPDGRGLQLRGLEPRAVRRTELDPVVVNGLLRLARLAQSISHVLREHPDADVRRSAAVLAARAHPLLAALDA